MLAARATWATGAPKIIVVPGTGGFQSVNLHAGGGSSSAGTALGAGTAAAGAIGVMLCVVLALVSRSRGRRVLLGAAVALSVVAAVALARAAPGARERAERSGLARPRLRAAPIAFAVGGAVAAAAGSVVAFAASEATPAARLPETAPGEPEAPDG